jgi:hypothetical protein
MRRLITIAALLAAGLLIAACGSSSPSKHPASASASATVGSPIAFAKCMRAHGVPNFPDPGANGNGGFAIQATQRAGSGSSMTVDGVTVNAPAFQSAMQTCSKLMPGGGAPSAAQSAKMRAAALAMSRCMRAHGVTNFPDPKFGTGPGGGVSVRIGGPGSGIDPSSPAFQAAQKICMPLMTKAVVRESAVASAP